LADRIALTDPVSVFEQLKNLLMKRRGAKLQAAGHTAVQAVLSDWDYFLLGAFSKLGEYCFVQHDKLR
jgi:hypothetical protein